MAAVNLDGVRPYLKRPILRPSRTAPAPADADLLGKAVTFSNYTPGSPKTIDMQVGGVGYNMVNLNTGVTHSGGTALEIDGVTPYKFADGTKYQGVVIILDPTIVDNTPTATIYIADGAQLYDENALRTLHHPPQSILRHPEGPLQDASL